MRFNATPLAGAYLVEIAKIGDERGFFGRSWCQREMAEHGLDSAIAQINTSFSRHRGTLRGLHFQVAPYQESKLIRCTRGAIFDVIVDLRPHSATRGQWYGAELTADNHLALYSPKGFAQGFITLQDDTEITYIASEPYAPGKDRGVRWDDPQFGIRWPLQPLAMSDKDRQWPDFTPEVLT
jgi:dTDP-4-dehydrorhamnose 3,5-epimerase